MAADVFGDDDASRLVDFSEIRVDLGARFFLQFVALFYHFTVCLSIIPNGIVDFCHFRQRGVPVLNYVWSFLVTAGIICSVFLGKTENLSNAFVDSAADAIQLLITLAGVICLWSGLMKIAEKSGLNALVSRMFAPLLKPLFPNLDKNGAAFEAISMNISANLLGLGNTATPLGLRAMKELDVLNGKSPRASDEMVVFVVMNTASLQLMPTMLGSLRASYGSSAPFEILVPVWISSACALTTALVIAVTGNRLSGRKKWKSLCPPSRV